MLRQTLQAVGALELMAELDSFFDRFRIRASGASTSPRTPSRGSRPLSRRSASGRMERLFTPPSSELSLLRVIRRGAIGYMGLPRAQDKESGRFGQLFLADLDAVIQEIQATEGRLAHAPFTIILDEFSSYAIHEFSAVFEQARSAGIAVIVSVQTPSALADPQRGLSEEFRDSFVGNCGTILSFRLGPGRGAQYLSDYVGKADRWFWQESQTEGRTPHLARAGPLDVVRAHGALGSAVALHGHPAAEGSGPRGARAHPDADPHRRGVPAEPAGPAAPLDRVGRRGTGAGGLALSRGTGALGADPAAGPRPGKARASGDDRPRGAGGSQALRERGGERSPADADNAARAVSRGEAAPARRKRRISTPDPGPVFSFLDPAGPPPAQVSRNPRGAADRPGAPVAGARPRWRRAQRNRYRSPDCLCSSPEEDTGQTVDRSAAQLTYTRSRWRHGRRGPASRPSSRSS